MNQQRQRYGIFTEAFWRNDEVTRFSRGLLLAMLLLAPAGYLAGKYYVPLGDCVARSKTVYIVGLGLLVAYSIYFWVVDRPAVLNAYRDLLRSGHFRIQKVGWKYELWQGEHYHGYNSLGRQLRFTAIYLLVLIFWCFWTSILQRACDGRLMGSPSVAIVMLGTVFMLAIVHLFLLWIYATQTVWRGSR
jgi:hypothetical protein